MIAIYGLFDPRTTELRYIGKSTSPAARLATHIRESRKASTVHSRCWVAGLLKENARPELEVIEWQSTHDDANEAERFWIAYFRSLGCRLTNRTPGGDGQPKGYKPSAEAIAKAKLKTVGSKRTPEQRQALKEAFNRPDVREQRRRNVEILKVTNPEWLEKVRKGRTGIPQSDEAKRKIAASWTPERKAKHAQEKSALPFDEKRRQQLKDALKKRWDKYRADIAAATCSQPA